jgi:predicted Fe-Mo cluster-binding NifX family protein
MRIVVSANGADLEAAASSTFGRCPMYVFVDTETIEFEAVENPATNVAGGAGIQAAQFIVEQGAQAVISGMVGPNASDVLQAASVPVYSFEGGTVRQAVEAFKAGRLSATGSASAGAHAGAGSVSSDPVSAREEEVAALRLKAAELREQLADVVDRLDRLEKGG